jgi:predicted GNAT family acetyltransferase
MQKVDRGTMGQLMLVMAILEVNQIFSASEFLKLSGETLYAREAEYSLMLGLSEVSAQQNKNTNLFYNVKSDAQDIGFCLVSDRAVVMNEMSDEAVRALADQLFFDQVNFPGAVGPVATVESFAKIWAGITEKKFKIGMSQKIYQLNKVISAKAVGGRLIVASAEHQDLITQWVYAFSLESLPHENNSIERAKEFAVHKIPKGEVFIWQNEAGKPVSMNAVGRPTKQGISVSAVYTRVEYRKQGFASAVVAGTSQRMLDQGKKFCVLYTDLANPTSNKIYQDIGYKEVATSVMYLFT